MKKFIVLVLSLILMASVYAIRIEIDVAGSLGIRVTNILYNDTVEVFESLSELYNTESISYTARMRMDFYNESNSLVYSAWSQEKPLAPGDRQSYFIYWYPKKPGNYLAHVRVYFGNEILDYKKINFTATATITETGTFTVSDFRTFDEYIKFRLSSNETVENVIVYASKYPTTWIFEQSVVGKLESGKKTNIVIPYEPTFWNPTEIEITVVTLDGNKYSTYQVFMQRETGIKKYLIIIFDWMRDRLQ